MLKQLLYSHYNKRVKLDGQERNQFVPWIRDHVHVMKAMKNFSTDIQSFWEFFMQQQTAEGLYYDYYLPIADPVTNA